MTILNHIIQDTFINIQDFESIKYNFNRYCEKFIISRAVAQKDGTIKLNTVHVIYYIHKGICLFKEYDKSILVNRVVTYDLSELLDLFIKWKK